MSSLVFSLRVAAAVFRQRWRNNIRYPLNFVSQSLIGPISWLAPVYFLGRSFAPDGRVAGLAAYTGSADYMTFLLVGGVVGQFISGVLWGMGYALKLQMDQGVLEANWLTPAPRFAQLVGQSLFNLVYTALQLLILLAAAALLFGFHPSGSFWLAVGYLVPVFVGLYGFGFAFAGLTLLMRDPNALIDMSDFGINFLSGQQFPIAVLPPLLAAVSLVLPSTYAIDGLRGILMHTRTLLPLGTEFGLLCGLGVALLVAGRWCFAWLERYCRVRGTLALR